MANTDFPTGLNSMATRQTAKEAMPDAALLVYYYLGHYCKHNDTETWHYTYKNALPYTKQEDIAKFLGVSRAKISRGFCWLREHGYIIEHDDFWQLPNSLTQWRAIPPKKLQKAFEYVAAHKGETYFLETYCALLYFRAGQKKCPSENLTVTQILQLYGHAATPTTRAKVIDALAVLSTCKFCVIESHTEKFEHIQGRYWVYKIVDMLSTVTPTYDAKSPERKWTEEELSQLKSNLDNADSEEE